MISLAWQQESDRPEAEQLARHWGLHCGPAGQQALHLLRADHQWWLVRGSMRWRPDWLEPAWIRRYRQAGPRREPLARACGLKGGLRPDVCDVTAGLGRDGCLLAVLGCSVTLVEAHPVMHLLLEQARRQAVADPRHGAVFSRVRLVHADSALWLPGQQADVICLDPMFASGDLRGQVKGAMQLIRALQQAWPLQVANAADLLSVALEQAGRRVVVKRARRAPPLPGPPPHHRVEAGHCRFDVYVKH